MNNLDRILGGRRPGGHPHYSVQAPIPALQAALWNRITTEVLARQKRPQEGAQEQREYDNNFLHRQEQMVDPTSRVRKGGARNESVLGNLHGTLMNRSSTPDVEKNAPLAEAKEAAHSTDSGTMNSSTWKAVKNAAMPSSSKRSRDAEDDAEIAEKDLTAKVSPSLRQKMPEKDDYAPGPPVSVLQTLPVPKSSVALPPTSDVSGEKDVPASGSGVVGVPVSGGANRGSAPAAKRKSRIMSPEQRQRLDMISKLMKEKKMSMPMASREVAKLMPGKKGPAKPSSLRLRVPEEQKIPVTNQPHADNIATDRAPYGGQKTTTSGKEKKTRMRSEKQKARDALVKDVMKKHGLKLGAANKYVKEHKLA